MMVKGVVKWRDFCEILETFLVQSGLRFSEVTLFLLGFCDVERVWRVITRFGNGWMELRSGGIFSEILDTL